MSKTTLDALDAAVRAHLADENPGQYVTGWALTTATTTESDDATDYDTECPAAQPAHVTLGLLDIGKTLVLDTRGGTDG
ncbi:hypothetical protein [Georgenia faecalis]|uniref:hypothetical protein n=1 Tax=Georgenia faecalis TaxID=2483799 RepID=UPI000FDC5F21|nr:hypothetical protein [Georgenia faecalis]